MRRSYWPAEPLRPGNSPGFKAPAMVCNMGRIGHLPISPMISVLRYGQGIRRGRLEAANAGRSYLTVHGPRQLTSPKAGGRTGVNLEPPQPGLARRISSTHTIARRIENPAHAPTHRLAVRPTAVARVTPIIDFAGGAKGVADEGPSNLTLQTTTAGIGRVRRKLQVGIASPTVRGRRRAHPAFSFKQATPWQTTSVSPQDP
jgi:hypothetical protein